MEVALPTNRLKKALREGHVQIGLWSSLASHVSAEVIAGAGFDWVLIDTEHSPNELPLVLSSAPGDERRDGERGRQAGVERRRDLQAAAGYRGAELRRSLRAVGGGSAARGGRHPVSPGRDSRDRDDDARESLRAGQELRHARQRRDLRDRADRNRNRGRQHRDDCRRRRCRWALHRAERPRCRTRPSGQQRPSERARRDRRCDRAVSGRPASAPASSRQWRPMRVIGWSAAACSSASAATSACSRGTARRWRRSSPGADVDWSERWRRRSNAARWARWHGGCCP